MLSFGLVPHEIKDNDLWREAGKLKALHNIPLADAFAAATANHLKATLVAGEDADFEGVEVDMMRVKGLLKISSQIRYPGKLHVLSGHP